MLKERETHESMRIMSKKLKLEKDPNALGKAKSSQTDSIAMLAREH